MAYCAACGAALEDDEVLVGGWAGSSVGGGVCVREGDSGKSAGCNENLQLRNLYSNEFQKLRKVCPNSLNMTPYAFHSTESGRPEDSHTFINM